MNFIKTTVIMSLMVLTYASLANTHRQDMVDNIAELKRQIQTAETERDGLDESLGPLRTKNNRLKAQKQQRDTALRPLQANCPERQPASSPQGSDSIQ